MNKILDEKTNFKNNYMEIKRSSDMKRISKIWDQYRAKGNIEFVEMLKNGFDSTYNVLVEENSQLRSWLLTLQTELKELVDAKMNLIKNNKSKYKDDILKNINMKLYRLKIIHPRAFKLSLNENINDILAIFQENIERVTKFIDAFVNPHSLFEFIDRINENPKLRESIFKVHSLDDLYQYIINLSSLPSQQPKAGESKGHRTTAKWNTDFTNETGNEEGIYKMKIGSSKSLLIYFISFVIE